jgi:hypothetical protein
MAVASTIADRNSDEPEVGALADAETTPMLAASAAKAAIRTSHRAFDHFIARNSRLCWSSPFAGSA